jgi:hypothetical protein
MIKKGFYSLIITLLNLNSMDLHGGWMGRRSRLGISEVLGAESAQCNYLADKLLGGF